MPHQTVAYECDYCRGKFYRKTKKSVEEHEPRCFYNPIRKACSTCKHLTTENQTVYNPYHNGVPGSTDYEVPILYCGVIEELTFTEYDSRKADTMRVDCDQWEMKDENGND